MEYAQGSRWRFKGEKSDREIFKSGSGMVWLRKARTELVSGTPLPLLEGMSRLAAGPDELLAAAISVHLLSVAELSIRDSRVFHYPPRLVFRGRPKLLIERMTPSIRCWECRAWDFVFICLDQG